jgi:Flp pilus assembly CpaF family ATPase
MEAVGPAASLAGELVEQVRTELVDAAGERRLSADDEQALAAALLTRALAGLAETRLRAGRAPLSADDEERLAAEVMAALFSAGPLDRYLADPKVTDVIAHGADVVHVIYTDGRRERVGPLVNDDEALVELVRTLAREAGARFDAASVEANFALPDGSRIFAALGVAARPVLVARRHHLAELSSLSELVSVGTLDPELATLLKAMILGRQNVIISGGPSAGKTTLCASMLREVPEDDHVVTVEDTFELGLDRDPKHPMVTALLSRPPNSEGAGEVSLEQLTRMALRASPDRVAVGEVRGPEVRGLLSAMSQGSEGSVGTCHCSSSAEAPLRLASYAVGDGKLRLEEALFLVATAVDFVVHVERDRDGRRKLTSVREINPHGTEGMTVSSAEIYAPGQDGGAVPTGVPISVGRAAKLADAGWTAAAQPVTASAPW